LSDTQITLEQENSPPGSGYGAGTPYSSSESFLYVYRGHRYCLLKIEKIGGMSIGVAYIEPRETREESAGEWKIQGRGGAATLVLTSDNGGADYYRIEKAASDAEARRAPARLEGLVELPPLKRPLLETLLRIICRSAA
jgi:hypothetical protein